MRLRLGIACILLLLLSTTAFAAPTRDLVLNEENTATEIRVLSATDKEIILQLELPSLEVEDLEIAGQSWQRLSIPGGALSGEDGQAACRSSASWSPFPRAPRQPRDPGLRDPRLRGLAPGARRPARR